MDMCQRCCESSWPVTFVNVSERASEANVKRVLYVLAPIYCSNRNLEGNLRRYLCIAVRAQCQPAVEVSLWRF